MQTQHLTIKLKLSGVACCDVFYEQITSDHVFRCITSFLISEYKHRKNTSLYLLFIDSRELKLKLHLCNIYRKLQGLHILAAGG